jgi:hypothetical protein
MSATFLLVTLAFGLAEAKKDVTEAEKKAFLKELAKLPTRGEFFTEKAIKKAVPWTRVLLALTKKDLEKHDIYPFLALSSGLLDHQEPRRYGTAHFATIAHPTTKLFWAAGLFEKKAPSPEVVTFLRKAVNSRQDARTLSQMLGPHFEEFKERVITIYEAGTQTKVELVKEHARKPFRKYGGGFNYTGDTCIFAPGQLLYAVRPLKQRGELSAYNIASGKTRRLVVPQPKGFKAKYDFSKYYDNPVLSVNSRGDLFCRWAIEGNGDHALAVLKNGSDEFLVKRVKRYLAECLVLADPEGAWYLIQGAPKFTVYQVDKDLNLKDLGTFKGQGHHSVRILDARFISKAVLHLFWGDVLSDNQLRMRCVDFDVRERKWLHDRTIFRLDKCVSSANEPTVLQLKDGSFHYVWKIDEGSKQGEATGLYYQAEADGKTVKVGGGFHYRGIAVGGRIVVCYTLEGSPTKVFFRVIRHGAPGPVTAITAARGWKDNLWSEYMVLYSESDRIWFVNTLSTNTLYELKLVDSKKR